MLNGTDGIDQHGKLGSTCSGCPSASRIPARATGLYSESSPTLPPAANVEWDSGDGPKFMSKYRKFHVPGSAQGLE